ncbi:hypothetical protein EPUL_003351 [Erysiphe pulchra]|uniref:Uncharacterized protein n=1 Tax=Erysiphe pulchra TaxID=225359 RepID=A0A2S4PUM0_9PEZI|nr:hypothetical protein EPUL_003351 [Erysiphe pulchra]
MTSPLFPDDVKTSPKNSSRPAARKKIIPAIPLSYLRMRQKMQAKRAMALLKAENTVQPTNKDDKSQESLEKCDSPPQSNASLNKPIGMNGLKKNDEPAPLNDSASGLGKVENIAESSYSMESSDNSSKDKSASLLGERAIKEENAYAKHGSSQTDDSSHKLVPRTQLQNDNVHIEDRKLSQPQSLKLPNAPLDEKTDVYDNSESSKSSPAPPQSTAHPTPSFNHEQPLPGRYLTHRYNSGFPQHLSHVRSPVDQPPSQGYYMSLNGLGNSGPLDKFGREQIIPVRSWQEICPTVKQLDPRHLCDPTTPHSFHGSQSSAQDRDIGKNLETQNSPVISNNNFNGNLEYIQNYPTNPIIDNRDNHPPLLPILQNNVQQLDMFDGLIEYLSSQFANPKFADYTLELRYSDDRAAPVRIPGHNLMFARSITLRQMMLAARNETDGISSKTLLIESNDRFICTDGLYMAMHRLYGNALLDLGAIIPIGPTGQYELPLVSTSTERFDLVLGYAAAGHLLKMDVVVDRGCEIASQALNWINLERGLDFALDGGLEPQWKIHSWDSESPHATYGSSVNIIIVKAIRFICLNLPAQFKLDTSVIDARFTPRLPKIPGQRHTCLNLQLSQIRFGDHAAERFNQLETQQIPTVVLSRIFISLPWELLRYLFESSHLATTVESLTLRHQILCSVVREREKRRLYTYNSSISNYEREKNSQIWSIVGWKEEVEALRGDEMYPKLIRSWVDFRTPES